MARKKTQSAMEQIFNDNSTLHQEATNPKDGENHLHSTRQEATISQQEASDYSMNSEQKARGIATSNYPIANDLETKDQQVANYLSSESKFKKYNEKTTAIRINRNTLNRVDKLLEDSELKKKDIAEVLLNGLLDYPQSCQKILTKKLGDERAQWIIEKAIELNSRLEGIH